MGLFIPLPDATNTGLRFVADANAMLFVQVHEGYVRAIRRIAARDRHDRLHGVQFGVPSMNNAGIYAYDVGRLSVRAESSRELEGILPGRLCVCKNGSCVHINLKEFVLSAIADHRLTIRGKLQHHEESAALVENHSFNPSCARVDLNNLRDPSLATDKPILIVPVRPVIQPRRTPIEPTFS